MSVSELFESIRRRFSSLVLILVGTSAGLAGPAGGTARGETSDIDAEPYTVYVAHDAAYTRCGPGGDFYRTEALRHGQALDVYLETEDGWLGVRPPDDSFSWIPSEDVELDSRGETGTVTQDRSVVWIGTQLGRARQYRWQIQLPEGESVTVLGRSEREGPDGPMQWYRIVPPSGEFRWVHREQIVETAEALVESVERSRLIAEKQAADAKATRDETARSAPAARPSASRRDTDQATRSRFSVTQASAKSPSITETPDLVPRRRADERTAESADPESEERQDRFAGSDPATAPGSLIPIDGPAELQPIGAQPVGPQPIGSGLAEKWLPEQNADEQNTGDQTSRHDPRPNPVQDFVSGRSEARFTGQPRLLDSRHQADLQTPQPDETAGDSNWVGASRAGAVAQVSNLQPMKTHDLAAAVGRTDSQRYGPTLETGRMTSALSRAAESLSPSVRHVDADRVDTIRREAATADIARLQLVFSRLIADAAAAAEIEPIQQAAARLAATATDALVASRAKVLVERAQQYRRIARRRDGNDVVQGNPAPSVVPAIALAPNQLAPNQLAPNPDGPTPLPEPIVAAPLETAYRSDAPADDPGSAGEEIGMTGKLVQVYSARAHHPPFALQDNVGRTVAYVTPSPGFNIRRHLNSEVRVIGDQGFLTGLQTPHVLATKAVRIVR